MDQIAQAPSSQRKLSLGEAVILMPFEHFLAGVLKAQSQEVLKRKIQMSCATELLLRRSVARNHHPIASLLNLTQRRLSRL